MTAHFSRYSPHGGPRHTDLITAYSGTDAVLPVAWTTRSQLIGQRRPRDAHYVSTSFESFAFVECRQRRAGARRVLRAPVAVSSQSPVNRCTSRTRFERTNWYKPCLTRIRSPKTEEPSHSSQPLPPPKLIPVDRRPVAGSRASRGLDIGPRL